MDTVWPGELPENLHIFLLHEYRKAQAKWSEIVDRALHESKTLGAQAVFIDTFGAWAGFDESQENDAAAADKAIGELSKLAAEGISVVIDRHGRKSGGEIIDAARGSSAIGGGADILLFLRKKEGNQGSSRKRILEAVGRFPVPEDGIEIELGNNGRYISNGAAVSDQAKENKDLVLSVMNDQWMSRNEIQELAGLSKKQTCTALIALYDFDNAIDRIGSGNKFQYRKLV